MSTWASSVLPPIWGVRITFGSPCRRETNASSSPDGSSTNTSTAAPARCPDSMWARSDPWSTTKPRLRLRNNDPSRIGRELGLPEQPTIVGPAVDMQGHDVCPGRAAPPRSRTGGRCRGPVGPRCRRTTPTFPGSPPAPTVATRCCRSRRCPGAGPGPRGLPTADLDQMPACMSPVLLGEAAGQRDDLGDHQLHHAAGVGEGGVEHRHAPPGRGGQVDLVGADAERPDRQQAEATCRARLR